MDYAVIKVGGKQHKVRDGETLVVDRIKATDVGGTFEPDILLGDGEKVVVTVLAHERGPKIRIGKYRKRTGYKRHNGFRASTSRIEISLGGAKKKTAAAAPAKQAEPKAEAAKVEAPATEEHVKGMPHGYEDMTVAQVSEGAKTWN